MTWKASKGAFEKFSGKHPNQDPTIKSVDNAHYRGTLIEAKEEDGQLVFTYGKIGKRYPKDSAYYEYKGIPKKDAKLLAGVVQRAKILENGFTFLGKKIGVNTIIDLVPAAGDFVGTGLGFVLVVAPALLVSKGAGRSKFRWVILGRLAGGFLIGLVPGVGVIVDSRRKMNIRSANALEAMLLKRADEASKTVRHAEKVARTTGYQHATTNGHRLTATNGDHGSEPPTHPPPRFITANDLRQDPRPAATARAPVVQTQPKKSGGSFFRRREGPQGHQAAGTPMEEVAPVRPPPPQHSMHERGEYF